MNEQIVPFVVKRVPTYATQNMPVSYFPLILSINLLLLYNVMRLM